ncbi:MAG: AAA family ATPase, partial [Chlamydiia bacterium]|nr:AAA family ATPase [Chlamydiia bacterium]
MDAIFRRQEKRNVILVGPPGVGKKMIAKTYPGSVVLIEHFEKMEQGQLLSLMKSHEGKLVLCTRGPIPHKDLVMRYCTPIEVKEPSDAITKKIVMSRFPSVSEEVLDQTLELCRFYFPNQCQPGLLFDLTDGIVARREAMILERVKEALSVKTNSPIRTAEERENYYATAEEVLKRRVLGQDHVISDIAKVLENCGRGYWPSGVPIFHFAGPTGVGKTELAKAIGAFFYESERRLLHVSLSQYGEKHAVSALTGTTPGFVGFEMGGQITEKAKEGPFVLLLDEADKAHPDVITTLLQHVAEEGTLYDPKTQTDVSLKGCLIILTSNLGASNLTASQSWWTKPDLSDPEEVKKLIEPAMKRHFREELIARFQTYYFTPHTNPDVVKQIVHQLLQKEQERHSCTLTWTDDYVEAFTNMEKVQKEGVRWIRRSIETSLRHLIIRGNYQRG